MRIAGPGYGQLHHPDDSGKLWKPKQLYVDQLVCVNQLVEEVVDALISETGSSPVIVIQSDLGPASTGNWKQPGEDLLKERTGILNAYFLPGAGGDQLVEWITPVNTFRLIFDTYFDAGLGLLDDRSYFSDYDHPYQFSDVTDTVWAE